MKKYGYFIASGIILLTFIIFTVLVKTVDVNYLKISNTYLGFYTLNIKFGDFISSLAKIDSMIKISDIILYLSFGYIAILFVFAIIQLVKVKSLKKLDKNFYLVLGGYVAVVAIYFIFEIVKVNYSPDSYVEIIYEIPGDPTSAIVDRISHLHASYPSSHVLLGCMFYLLNSYTALKLLKPEKEWIKDLIFGATGVICLLQIFTRAMTNKHWLTDIIASIILVSAIYTLFIGIHHKLVLEALKEQKEVE